MAIGGELIRSEFAASLQEEGRSASETLAEQCQEVWQRFGLSTPRVAVFPGSVLPHSRSLPRFFEIAEGGDIDAILLANHSNTVNFDKFRSLVGKLQVPTINVSRRQSHLADVDFILDDPQSWGETAAAIRGFRDRRALLSETFRDPATPALRLIAHMFVSGEDLVPLRVPHSRYFFAYRGFRDTASLVSLAEALSNAGMLERRFMDRHPVCANCRSHRMVVREECPTCGSADLSRANFVHHYSCAWVGPETAFRHGARLICPKCSKQLRHYGKDYDKPTDLHVCGGCGNATTEAAVSFTCQDCTAKIDGNRVDTVDIYAYSLSGHATIGLTGESSHGLALSSVTIDGLPPELRRRIQDLGAGGGPERFVMRLDYGARKRIVEESGEKWFQSLRALFLERLQGLLADVASVESCSRSDYVLVHSMDRRAFDARSAELLDKAESVIAERLDAHWQAVWSEGSGTGRG